MGRNNDIQASWFHRLWGGCVVEQNQKIGGSIADHMPSVLGQHTDRMCKGINKVV